MPKLELYDTIYVEEEGKYARGVYVRETDAICFTPGDCTPAVLAHEIGHWKLGHRGKGFGGVDDTEAFEQEVEAWGWAKDRVLDEEDRDFAEDVIEGLFEAGELQ